MTEAKPFVPPKIVSRFATADSLDGYMNRAPRTVTPVSAQAAIEESFFLGLRLNRGIDLDLIRREIDSAPIDRGENQGCVEQGGRAIFPGRDSRETGAAWCSPDHNFIPETIAVWESAIAQCVQDGLLEQQDTTLRLTARGRLLSNEVFARFLAETTAETKVGTGHVNPR